MINIKNFDSKLLKIDKKLYKNIDLYYIGYITTKIITDYECINSVNPSYIVIGKADGYIEENNGNKPGKYEKDFIKIRFNSDDNLPLNKILKLHNLTVIVRYVFQEGNNYYP